MFISFPAIVAEGVVLRSLAAPSINAALPARKSVDKGT